MPVVSSACFLFFSLMRASYSWYICMSLLLRTRFIFSL